MKKLSILLIAILFCSLQGHAQFWISFGWNEPHCQNCLWMEQAIRMTNRQAAEYHKIIHKYGRKIEHEALKDCRYWIIQLRLSIVCAKPGSKRRYSIWRTAISLSTSLFSRTSGLG